MFRVFLDCGLSTSSAGLQIACARAIWHRLKEFSDQPRPYGDCGGVDVNDFKRALHLSTVVDGEQDTVSLIEVKHVGIGYNLNS